MDVVVVESPAKAKTINKYLGRGYKVLASFGHVRDLAEKDGSVLPEQDFAMTWVVDGASAKRLADIAKAVKEADGLILATDPDREGEAISWHVLEVLRQKRALKDKKVSRVVFNAITKQAVTEAMANPREVDGALVDAYLARRALDYLVGFTLSPVLWRKLPGARSAGRVQSVALRLVCDREAEIERFVREDYFLVAARLATPRKEPFEARLTAYDGRKLQKLDIKTRAEADAIRAMLDGASFRATDVESKPTKRNPAPPFITSTLQQAASSRLGFSASRTMQVAQRLYEGVDIGGETAGLITYMRTDGVQMAPEAISAARGAISEQFGARYLPEKPRHYSTKAKNAQEAHEAIRPTDFRRTPDSVRKLLDTDQAKLYEMIWKRAIASQMAAAEIERTTVDIEAANGAKRAELRATGSVIRFDGFIAAYTEDRNEDAEDEDNKRLPEIKAGEALAKQEILVSEHTTEPPPRYSEASLIRKLEELGIGRPSTYAAILKTLEDRGYVANEKRRLIPQAKGRVVTAFLESFFRRYVEFDFTAALEEKLDDVSGGRRAWKDVLAEFWKEFSHAVDDIKELRITDVLAALTDELAPLIFPAGEEGKDPRVCPKCGSGQLSLKLGKYGAFVGCSNYPDCGYTRQLGEAANENGAQGDNGTRLLGTDPYTNEEITVRSGRFGPYVQRGEGKEAKRASLPKGWATETIDHEKALALLSLPRDIGRHPESGKMISAGIGKYGPYVAHDGVFANLENAEEVFSIGLNRAVSVLAEKVAKGPGGRARGTPAELKTLGDHPDGGPVTVRDGRYGPYINWGKVNATLPKGKAPDSVTMEEALALIAAKAEQGGAPKRGFARKAKKSVTARRGRDGESGGGLPDRDAILEWIRDNPDRASRRDIAKAFGIKATQKRELTELLRSLAEEGLTQKTRKNFRARGALPAVTVLDVFGRDSEGGLLARPSEWDESAGEAPVVHIRLPRFQKGAVPGVGARVLAKIFRNEGEDGPLHSARVLKIFERKREQTALGVLRRADNGSWRAEPIERRQPEFLLDEASLGAAKPGDLVEVAPIGRPERGLPRARVVAVIGPAITEKAASMIAIHAHGIPHEFPQPALDEADNARPASMEGREDWRAIPFVTIDPADAKDHDDAVHAEPDPDVPGGFIVRVAIADVATYVTPGSALDREALRRGNSVYFPDRVVPMLPERISNDLCSLRELEDRPALALRMTFAPDGRKSGHSLHRVMIRSVAKLAYPQAQAAVDGAPDDKTRPLLEPVLKPLYAAYAVLERGRRERGPLELDLPERKILLKADGTVDRVVIPERLAAHRLIEEFMIQANVAAAETLEAARQALIYRIHDAPSLAKQEALRGFLKTLSMSLARGAQLRPAQFNAILAKVEGSDLETLVNEVVLRSQSQAEYSKANIGHFGLNLRRYAHFTSPIRRYADLIVHRALIAAGRLGDDGLTKSEEARLEEISALISAAERRAMAAERDTVDRLVAAHLSGRIGETFDARVSGVARAGVFVQLSAFGADGFVPVSTLEDDYYVHDEALHALVGSRSGKGFRLGDSVEVSLTDVQPLAGSMQMKMESEPRPIAGATISFHKSRGPRRRAMATTMRGRRRT